jgi:hypothetical protein
MWTKEEKSEYSKQYYINHKEHLKRLSKEYKANNNEKRLIKQRKYYSENKEEQIKLQLQRLLKLRYNITPEDYKELFDIQEGKCAICGTHQNDLKQNLCVDHNHKTGAIRGLLCGKCNRGIGNLNDNIITLENAINYLKRT